LRTDKPDRTGLTVNGTTVLPDQRLVEHCQAFVKYLNYSGPGCMQFLIDSDGKPTFLEHNARLGASLAGVYQTGLDLPMLMVNYALHDWEAPEAPDFPCETGVRFAWTTGDLIGMLKAIQSRDIGLAGAIKRVYLMFETGLTSPVHLTWDWRDPVPAIVRLSYAFMSELRRVTAKVKNDLGDIRPPGTR